MQRVQTHANEVMIRISKCHVALTRSKSLRLFSNIPLSTSKISQLRTNGFTVINLPSIATTLAPATSSFTKLNQFRYPRNNYDNQINAKYQQGFDTMYFLTAAWLHQMCPEFPLPPTTTSPFDMSNESPFCGSQASKALPYSDSFASIFNFNHGFLNSHFDRGLLTAVYGRPEPVMVGQHKPAVSLWCQNVSTGEWVDLGKRTGDGDIIIMVGEQLENSTGGTFKAVQHACRVDPTNGQWLNTKLPKDPEAPDRGNRQSIAFVLCAPT